MNSIIKSNKSSPKTLLELIGDEFEISRGHPLPLGATIQRKGVNFSLFSKHCTSVTLVLFDIEQPEIPVAEFPLDPGANKTGDIWHIFVRGLDPGIAYGYRLDRSENIQPQVHRFNPSIVVMDPYCKAVSGTETWGDRRQIGKSKSIRQRSNVIDESFDWNHDQPLNYHLADSVIYELHVRGFTRHPNSKVKHPGTFNGLTEKIPYLRELGVTAVELLPVTEFDECDTDRVNPETGETLTNFWGYHPIALFAPKTTYASNTTPGGQTREFKEMVRAFHEAGIEVILDMVFNHTGEGDHRGTTYSFRGIDNDVYYIIDNESGEYRNYSGCGNTLNCNHPVVRDLILDALRYWVSEMHIDGFRFDLASILGRGQDGEVLPNPPLLERIAMDPLLADTKIIAEAWDAAGLYQVGSFPSWSRWAEWNGKYRDAIRRFVRGDSGVVSELATRIAGSADLYQTSAREPYHSINFVTCHDGFTLRDLVSYNEKHNLANGEENRDGCNNNLSWNCGEEGPTESPRIHALRTQQIKNMIALLFISSGVPMLLAGDEIGRSQQGNNNGYCQDNELNWIDWQDQQKNQDLFHFFRKAIAFRKAHPAFRRRAFVHQPEGLHGSWEWHGTEPYQPDWSEPSQSLAMGILEKGAQDNYIYVIANAGDTALNFRLPEADDQTWYFAADTSQSFPSDFIEPGKETRLVDQSNYLCRGRSVVILMRRV